MIVSMTQPGQPVHTYLDPSTPLTRDDIVYAIGSDTQLDQLGRLLESHT